MTWKIDPTDTTGHVAAFQDKEHGSFSYVRWDGCINLFWGEEGMPEDERCYHHFCPGDIEQIIAWLKEVQYKALIYFGETEFGIGGNITAEQRHAAIERVQQNECLDN